MSATDLLPNMAGEHERVRRERDRYRAALIEIAALSYDRSTVDVHEIALAALSHANAKPAYAKEK